MAILTKEYQEYVDSIIEDIKLRTGLSYPENSLLDITKAEGISVFEADLDTFMPRTSGVLRYEDDKNKTNPQVFLERTMSPERKTFTLAHELGHHYLHEGQQLRVENQDYSQEKSLPETQANYFAGSLLVPYVTLEPLIQATNGSRLESIAKFFGVSLPVIETRLNWIRRN